MSFALSILNDATRERTTELAARFDGENVLARLRADPATRDADAQLSHLGAGFWAPFDLPAESAAHPEWPVTIAIEIDALRARFKNAHGVLPRFVIWAGMGGSVEDKLAYEACGLLRGGPRFYALDSADPAKLKAIIHDLQVRSELPMPDLLRATLVVGMAMGMTSFEPVLNLEKIAVLYQKNGVDPSANLICLTLPGSLLDRFAEARSFARVPIQLDGLNNCAGRHSAPLTRGSLYPLALAGVDLTAWIDAARLSDDEIHTAWTLAAFLHAQGLAGREMVTFLPPRRWSGLALWTKQDFEESLGKSEQIGIKIVINEPVRTRFYQKPGSPLQNRCFLAVQLRGEAHPEADSITALRHMKYPVAVLTFPKSASVATWMQFVHYVVFGLAYLRDMNFVTQPSVELYKSIAAEIFKDSSGAAWQSIVNAQPQWTPERYASALRDAVQKGVSYAELTFFGDLRYSGYSARIRKLLDVAAGRVFRTPLKMPVDIYEGPAMNHSYHEMVIGHGRCFSTLIASARQARFPGAEYEPNYHMAQFAATRDALQRRGRIVVPLLVKDLEDASLDGLERFFNEVASHLFKHG